MITVTRSKCFFIKRLILAEESAGGRCTRVIYAGVDSRRDGMLGQADAAKGVTVAIPSYTRR